MLRVENLSKHFGGVAATNNISLDFAEGSLSAVIGPNGAGKTTFFNLITGALLPNAGRILLEGKDITGLRQPEIARRGIGRAFQIAAIFPSLTVRESILAAVTAHRRHAGGLLRRFPLEATKTQAQEVLEMIGLSARADTLSRNLSHGDQKLLDIALALALEPRVLLLDEPTAGMGPEERWQMMDTIRSLWQRQKMTVIFIEHDMDIVFKVAQRVRVLSYGTLLADGTPAEIRKHPEVIKAYLGEDHRERAP
jgi:branched-chain amino acid transport system ATP-binding protein